MKYDERACKFNMDTGCVELLLRDGRMISIDCTGIEDVLNVTMAQRSELDYLIYNDPLSYADLILNGNPEEYLKNVVGGHGSEDLSFRDYQRINTSTHSTAMNFRNTESFNPCPEKVTAMTTVLWRPSLVD